MQSSLMSGCCPRPARRRRRVVVLGEQFSSPPGTRHNRPLVVWTARGLASSGVGERLVLQVRAAEQITARLV